MARLLTLDYSTGSFTQWYNMLNTTWIGSPGSWPAYGQHPAQIVPLGDCGYAARFECGPGDVLPGLTSERTEVEIEVGPNLANTTLWYAFSIKFDESWPDQSSLGWLHPLQFRDQISGPISPTITFGWADTPETRSGYWYMKWNPQVTPGVAADTEIPGGRPGGNLVCIAEMPLELGKWHDIKTRIHWSSDDAVGTVQLWRNGVRQTFGERAGGGTTFTGRTLCPGASGVTIHQGIYRKAIAETSIVYHTGLRVADSEEDL